MVTATMVSAIAPITKAPMSAGFARLPMGSSFLAPREELAHARVGRVRQQLLRRAGGDHRTAVRVEEDAIVRDREDARELVGHDHDRRAEAVAQLEDQLVQAARAD